MKEFLHVLSGTFVIPGNLMANLRSALLLLIAVLPAHSGTIRGMVVEKKAGYALAHATVTIEPATANGAAPVTLKTHDNGEFIADNLNGTYLVKASLRGFMPTKHGQRRWNSAGTAVTVGGDEVVTLEPLQLMRYGAVTGIVRDQNEAGVPDQDVAAYTDTQPPRYISRARTDDRGVFRISGLEPGNYLVRTTGSRDEEISYLATFARQTLRVEDARPFVVYADEDATDADVRPVTGNLFDLSGAVSLPAYGNFTVNVTLASDLGRTNVSGPGFAFSALPPGHYELYAEARENRPGARVFGGYTEIVLDRNMTNYPLLTYEVRETPFVTEGPGSGGTLNGFARRMDMAGPGPTQPLAGRLLLTPGRWQFLVIPPDGDYVSAVSGRRDKPGRPDGWNDILINNFSPSRTTITFSSSSGTIRGTVRSSNMPAVTAPVFLEPWDAITRTRAAELHQTRTDARGSYGFGSLAPGDYRIVSTFDYDAPDTQAFDALGAQLIHVDASQNQQLDLELNGVP